MAKWPWNLEGEAERTKSCLNGMRNVRDVIGDDVGFMFVLGQMDVFAFTPDVPRRVGISTQHVYPMVVGDDVRNWQIAWSKVAIYPYDRDTAKLLNLSPRSPEGHWFDNFHESLSSRPTFSGTFAEAGREIYEYHQLPQQRACNPRSLSFPEIATHGHFAFQPEFILFSREAPVVKLDRDASDLCHHLLAGLLNSTAALFWLKQICFNKGAGEDEERDRFVYAGGKVERLPVPNAVADALRGKHNDIADRLTALSQACWESGRQMPALAMKKLFDKPGEAYYDWNSSLSGYVAPDSRLGQPFQTTEDLKDAFSRASRIREGLRAEMIALQEEMDWLVYVAYGLIPDGTRSVMAANADMATDVTGHVDATERIPPMLMREQRPFVLWTEADGDFDKSVALIPAGWSQERQSLWRARLETIRDNEHIRRIEQPVYKRRWDEQWKVGNRWQCGPVAYDAEFVDAFYWWLSEKAEWWLEKKRNGGPVALDGWTAALQQDLRVQAAWSVAREALERLGKRADFMRYFAALVKEQTVPDNIPAAVPWDELEKKQKIPAAVKRIRGKLNVPRERFRVTGSGGYAWAGVK
jgi:hypothetical protein